MSVKTLSRSILLTFLVGTTFNAVGDADFASEFKSYREMRTHLGKLLQEERFQDAAALLEWARERFPDNLYANSINLALVHGRLAQEDQGVVALDYALDRDVFFGKWDFENPAFKAYQDRDDFKKVRKRSEEMLAEAEARTVMKVEVETPAGYAPDRSWPLFIALHGGGENLEEFKPRWQSPGLKKKFVVAYVQSSQVASMTGFHWQNEEKTRIEIANAFKKVSQDYSVDRNMVIVGGFSSGGFASLVTTFSEMIPVAGFVVLCPPVPESLTDEQIERAAKRGLHGTVLSTEFDGRIEQQKSLVERLTRSGLVVELVVLPDVGHWYPDNLAELIDKALAGIQGS